MFQDDLMELCLAIKDNVFKSLHVATLGKVTKVDDISSVKPFPLIKNETSKEIKCYKLSNLELSLNDIVLVVFVDRNFINTLKQIKANQKESVISENDKLHSEQYGIIVGKI